MEINNTSFALEINEYFKQLTNDDVLRKHQQYVVEYLKTHHGILVKHDVGSGKSLIMAAILADQLNQVILLSSKSLHNNTRRAIEQYAEKTKKDINVDYTFVTMNASNMITQLKNAVNKNKKINFDTISALSLDNKTLIIDEAHSSQTGEAARHLRKALSLDEAENEDKGSKSLDDIIEDEIKSKGDQENISFFAFFSF
jgi:type I restriction enzyme R subunit